MATTAEDERTTGRPDDRDGDPERPGPAAANPPGESTAGRPVAQDDAGDACTSPGAVGEPDRDDAPRTPTPDRVVVDQQVLDRRPDRVQLRPDTSVGVVDLSGFDRRQPGREHREREEHDERDPEHSAPPGPVRCLAGGR